MISFIKEKKSTWDKLKEETRPIFIYGMGDGALKIMSVFRRENITLSGIFASDEFVRGHSFEGYKVHKLSEVEEMVDDFVVVLAFAAGYQEIVDKVHEIANKHTLYVPDVPVVGAGIFNYDYCLKHAEELQKVYDMLADDYSRKVYANIINFKISGDISYLDSVTTPKSEIYKSIIKPSSSEVYVDLGAYNGDTIREILEFTRGRYTGIYAVEPDRKNFKKLSNFVDGMKFVYPHNVAAWCVDTELPFASKAGRQSAISASSEHKIEARTVDSILGRKPASIIKMDVEGFEREAIWGAANTIARYSPKLMIAMYHRNEDIFELPLLVKMLNPSYKLYIRHQLYIPAWETNLYATL
ncbi:MAG: FkbM family methyltransferase [Ruminococcus sp.]|nr:FkbM family methyltransferase [Ruminococcus sp.]MDE7226650.1 FkbM family methyltransferase [Ruminococcus sp.]